MSFICDAGREGSGQSARLGWVSVHVPSDSSRCSGSTCRTGTWRPCMETPCRTAARQSRRGRSTAAGFYTAGTPGRGTSARSSSTGADRRRTCSTSRTRGSRTCTCPSCAERAQSMECRDNWNSRNPTHQPRHDGILQYIASVQQQHARHGRVSPSLTASSHAAGPLPMTSAVLHRPAYSEEEEAHPAAPS